MNSDDTAGILMSSARMPTIKAIIRGAPVGHASEGRIFIRDLAGYVRVCRAEWDVKP
jgi:nitrogen regulatory protein PII